MASPLPHPLAPVGAGLYLQGECAALAARAAGEDNTAQSWRSLVGATHAHPPVKLLIAILTRDIQVMEEIERRLESHYGPIEDRSEIFLFTFGTAFRREMGDNLKKRILCFRDLLPIEKFPDVKQVTNDLEWEYREHLEDRSRRMINLDPGYLT